MADSPAEVKLEWRRLPQEGQPPTEPGLHGHSMVRHGDKLWSFGGSCGGWCSDKLYYYDLRAHQWGQLLTTGWPLPLSADHSSILVDNKMICFGGRGHAQRRNGVNSGIPQPIYNHIFSIDLVTGNVAQLDAGGRLPPRKAFSAVVHDNALYVYAGWNHRDFFNDMFRLDLRLLGAGSGWEMIPQRGEVPESRHGHIAHVVGDRMITFGGTSKFSIDWGYHHFPDILSFDFKAQGWTKEPTRGEVHFGTEGHGSTLIRNGLLVWGGHKSFEFDEEMDWLDLTTMTWHPVVSTGDVPAPRCCMQMTTRVNQGREEVLSVGGYGPKYYGPESGKEIEIEESFDEFGRRMETPKEDPHLRYKDVHAATFLNS